MKKNLLMFFVIGLASANVFAQQKVTGKVIGEDGGMELPGVTVLVKGTTNGTITDVDGNFSLNVSEEEPVLVFSYVGYKSAEVPVNGRTAINVTLEVDTETLDEVVVVGYGEQKKANLTGAITTIEPESLEEIPTGNLSQTLIGKLAGVQVNRNGTGIPGTPSPLVIRAESASGMSRQVLYVIDGVIYSDNNFYAVPGPSGAEVFNRLDPSEIESISILKDAAAAVYGARGAGGVILVKTKRGQPGKVKVSYNGSIGIGQPTQIPEMLSGIEHARLWNEIMDIKESLGENVRGQHFTDEELAVIESRNHEWLDGLYKEAYNTKHAFTASGGSESVTYFLSGSYYKETGNYDNLWFKRYSIRTNLDYDVTDDLLFGIGINFSQGNRKNPNYDPGGATGEGKLSEWYKRPLTAPRWIPPTVNGNPVFNGSWNPYGLQQSDNYRSSSSDNTNLSARLEYDVPFLSGLKFSSLLSYNINTSYGTRFGQNYETYSYFTEGGLPSNDTSIVDVINNEALRENFEKGNVYQYNVSANYSKTIAKHNFSATLVYEQQNGNTRGFSASKSFADIRGFDYFWAFSNSSNDIGWAYNNGGRWSVIGRFNYDFDGKYLFESAFRSEASNKFHPDERFGTFPSISAGWVISEEPFFRDNISFIDFLKFRSSIGIVGNDNSAPFEWKPTFNAGFTGPLFGTGTGQVSNAIRAKNEGFYVPSRTWAKTRNFNVGMDVVSFNNKVNLTVEYYRGFTYDGFQSNTANAPYVLGSLKPPVENYKESLSQGIEFQFEYSDKIGNDIKYSINANFTRRHSRPTKLYQNPIVVGTWKDELKNDDSNQPGYVALGIIRDEEHLEEVKAMYPGNVDDDGVLRIFETVLAPGMLYFADVGGPNYSREPDGVLDGNDEGIIAEYTTPPYSYGLGLSFGWRSWRLNASFGGAFGHKEFIQKDEQVVNESSKLVVTRTQNTFSWWKDYWTPENTDASLPRPTNYALVGQHSTFWMRDGHTLRMNDISISYTMGKQVTDKIGLSNLKFYASATNVWTIISPFDYKDPAVSRAFDYPLVRMVNAGLSFSF